MLEKEEFNVFSREIIYIDSSPPRKNEFGEEEDVKVEPKIIYTDFSRVVTQKNVRKRGIQTSRSQKNSTGTY